MSGFVALINVDGAPVDRKLLAWLTDSLALRGPDGREMWCDDAVGLGLARLDVSSDTPPAGPTSAFDQRRWIVADARIDDRPALRAAIGERDGTDTEGLAQCSDAELILHAYDRWGVDCPPRLTGDFAFAIWDRVERRLLCARDHFGVKPLYFALVAGVLVVSNTLECIRSHPAVSDDLNERAIGDFLLFGYNREPTSTSFADVARLAPAHALTWRRGERAPRTRRFWTLPLDHTVYYPRPRDYVDRLVELLETAVRDRLRTTRVGLLMSGGLDSTAVAAVTHRVLSASGRAFDLAAYSHFYETIIPDEENRYAGLAARHLGIPIHYTPSDNYPLCQWQLNPLTTPPEPNGDTLAAIDQDELKALAATRRVALTGFGGDQVLHPDGTEYLISLVAEGYWGRALGDVYRSTVALRKLPYVSVRRIVRRILGRGQAVHSHAFPSWIAPEFVNRIQIADRWREVVTAPRPKHRRRPHAYQLLTDDFWPFKFESLDPGVTRWPVEVRHPFFDKRLVEYLLAIPAVPWLERKHILREAMRGMLPEAVRIRSKPNIPDPVHRFAPGLEIAVDPQLLKYVRPDALQLTGRGVIGLDAAPPAAICLNQWLRFRATRQVPSTA